MQGQMLDRRRVIVRVAGCTVGYYLVVVYRGVMAAADQVSKRPADGPAVYNILVALGSCWELWTAVGLLASHSFGAMCYVFHWPQRWYPRRFDLCVSARQFLRYLKCSSMSSDLSDALAHQGHSHNLMHVFCFACFVCGFPYLHLLHSKQGEWNVRI